MIDIIIGIVEFNTLLSLFFTISYSARNISALTALLLIYFTVRIAVSPIGMDTWL